VFLSKRVYEGALDINTFPRVFWIVREAMEGIDTIGFFLCGESSSVEGRRFLGKRYRFLKRGRSWYFRRRRRF
jgi:hypothetical protein